MAPTYGGTPVLTKAQAQACLPIVQAYIDKTEGPGWTPKLYEPGFHEPHWTIALECGGDNWPYYFGDAVYRGEYTLPPGVDNGAVNHWLLVLRPA